MVGELYKDQGNLDQHRATFFSPSEVWRLPAPSTIKPEKKEFVVDSRTSMHILSVKDFSAAELETVIFSRTPTKVITANVEVPANEEATVHVKDMDLFVTVQLLDGTPPVQSFGQLCEDHGYSYERTGCQKPTSY